MGPACEFCQQPFGRNTALPLLPWGREIAFDARRGIVWLVCGHCLQWTAVPGASERLLLELGCAFDAARSRHDGGHIGIADLPDGARLVRIAPDAPWEEYARYRYVPMFERRHQRSRRLRWTTLMATAVSVACVLFGTWTAFR